MSSAIVGHTGFVGSNIARARTFDHYFNSSNIEDAHGQRFDLLVFSAAKAEKWRINQNPAEDERHISELEAHLSRISADRVVLISTVDVYGSPQHVDERSPIDTESLHPYGTHRLRLERFVEDHFDRSHVLRLPGLFGPGLKKNVIFDLMTDNNVERAHTDAEFQYYDLARLWDDIEKVIDLDIPLLNVTSEPIATGDVAEIVLGRSFVNRPDGIAPIRYDVRSVHASAWSGDDGYLYDRTSVLSDLRTFVESNGRKAPR